MTLHVLVCIHCATKMAAGKGFEALQRLLDAVQMLEVSWFTLLVAVAAVHVLYYSLFVVRKPKVSEVGKYIGSLSAQGGASYSRTGLSTQAWILNVSVWQRRAGYLDGETNILMLLIHISHL